MDIAGSVSCPVTPLAPGESLTCTASYTVTQADVDAGGVTNVATPDGTPVQGVLAPVPTDTVTVSATAAPEMTIDKNVTAGEPYAAVGDVLSYDYIVTNTGNVTISDLAVTDDRIAVVSCTPTTLAPGDSVTCAGSYLVTQADLDAGSVTNIASPNGTPAQGTLPTPPTDTVTVVADPAPSMTVVKSITAGDPFAAVGDSITYSYLLTNTGNVTINSIVVDDDKVATVTCAAVTLAPTETTTCTGVYAVTQDDLNAGEVVNIAQANGVPTNGTLVSPTDTQTAIATQNSQLSLDKQITAGAPYNTAGDVITYTYDLNNSGNVSLSPPFSVNDDVINSVNCPPDASAVGDGDADLDPGETVQCSAVHVVSQADIDGGSIINTADAAAIDPNGAVVVSAPDTETAVADANANLAIDKELISGSPYTAVGDVVDYTYVVTNIGNVTVNTITVTDDRIATVSCLSDVLAPDESTTCSGQYTITQSDLNAGSVVNTAFASGNDPGGSTATSPTDAETATADQNPALALDKLFDGSNTYAAPGDVVSFTYEIINAGNVDITNISLTDDKIPTVSCPATSLTVGASMTCTGSYTVTQARH